MYHGMGVCSKKTTNCSQFSSTMKVPENKLRLSGLMASTFPDELYTSIIVIFHFSSFSKMWNSRLEPLNCAIPRAVSGRE